MSKFTAFGVFAGLQRVVGHIYGPSAPDVEGKLLEQARREGFVGNLVDLLKEKGWSIEPLAAEPAPKCRVPPAGWSCSRAPGHDGPCAATPEYERELDEKLGMVELPKIRISLATHRALAQLSKDRGFVMQAVVRDVLETGLNMRRLQKDALGGQVGDVVASHVITDARPVAWRSVSQQWVDA